MPKFVVVNPWHWLNANGSLPIEPRLRKQSIRVAQYIEYGGPLGLGEVRETLVSCRARGCAGLMMVLKQRDEAIQAFCQVCAADQFLIYEWEKTPWAQGHRPGKKVTEIAESHGNPSAYEIAREHLVMPLTCETGAKERAEAVAAFREGRLRALVSAQVLNEGFDVPEADIAIIVAGRLGEREYLQRVGRLLRPAPGKRARIYELLSRGTSEIARSARMRESLADRRAPAA